MTRLSLTQMIFWALFKGRDPKKTVELATSKPVREIGKKIIKHEINKLFK